jgi:hypothetical protein
MSTPFIWSSEAQSIGKVSCNLTKEMNNFVVSCWTLLSLEVCVTGALDLIYDNTLHMSLCNALFTNRTQDLEV